jgi:hypothetical protein
MGDSDRRRRIFEDRWVQGQDGTDERECFSEVCGTGDSDGEVQLADMTKIVKDLLNNFPWE